MKIDVLTLFPEMYNGFKTESIIKRAIENDKVEINIINFRNYTPLKNGQVDDTIYGGGAGMLIRCEPVFECIKRIKTKDSYIILLTPDGKTFNQKIAYEKIKTFTPHRRIGMWLICLCPGWCES